MRPLGAWQKILLAGLFAAYTAQALFLIQDKSPTTDETSFHMVNGYAYLKTGDFRMSPATPPLAREWMALPWLALAPKFSIDNAAWREAESVPFAVGFFYRDNRAIADSLLWSSRLMIFFFGIALAFGVFFWARLLYGPPAALVALGFYVFCPNIVAHSALAAIDMASALFYFGAVALLYRHWRSPDAGPVPWVAAIVLGLGLATKYTQVLVLPFFALVLWRKEGWLRGTLALTGALAVALAVTWATYGFELKPLLVDVPRVEEKAAMIRGLAGEAGVAAAHSLPVPLPSWILGFAGIARSHRAEYLHFFMGEWTDRGIWHHYLVSFALKSTLGLLLMLALRAASIFRETDRRAALFFLLGPPAILFAATLFDSTGVGMRYLVPALPFLFVWIGGLWNVAFPRRILKTFCVLFLAAHAASSLAQFPSNLAYFNALAGGPENGYRYLRGSDLDWGQELKSLGRWAEKNDIDYMRTYLFGTKDESFYGIPSEEIAESDFKAPADAVYAVSANYFDRLAWTAGLEPDARIGNAIFIYDMRKK